MHREELGDGLLYSGLDFSKLCVKRCSQTESFISVHKFQGYLWQFRGNLTTTGAWVSRICRGWIYDIKHRGKK